MRKFIIALSCAAFVAATPAAEVFQCVNPDVLNSLVFNARPESELVVRRAMPDIVAGFRAPAEFTLIGSGVRGQNLSTVVAYKTTAEGDKAFESLLAFLAADGWKREAAQQAQRPEVTVGGPPPLAARLCRDGERRNLLVQEIDGIRYATIFGFETTPPRACNAPVRQQNFQLNNPMAAINALQASLPQFSFPETARMSGTPGVGNDFGTTGMVSTSARIESPDTGASLASYLGRQLASQGWRSDAEWKGALSNGSTWTRRNNEGETYWGTLEILSSGEGVYDVGFLLASRP